MKTLNSNIYSHRDGSDLKFICDFHGETPVHFHLKGKQTPTECVAFLTAQSSATNVLLLLTITVL